MGDRVGKGTLKFRGERWEREPQIGGKVGERDPQIRGRVGRETPKLGGGKQGNPQIEGGDDRERDSQIEGRVVRGTPKLEVKMGRETLKFRAEGVQREPQIEEGGQGKGCSNHGKEERPSN